MHCVRTEDEVAVVKIPVSDMRVGEVGVVHPSEKRNVRGMHLMRIYDGYILLEEPGRKWGVNCSLTLDRIYGAGTTLTLTLGNGI